MKRVPSFPRKRESSPGGESLGPGPGFKHSGVTFFCRGDGGLSLRRT